MQSIKRILTMTAAVVVLASCGSDDKATVMPEPMTPEPVTYSFEVTVQNLTNNQPLSPVTVLSHAMDVSLWQLGQSASMGVEYTAEAGDNTMLISDNTNFDNASSEGLLMPGNTATLMLTTDDENNYLSIISMLVNTNDAFTGLVQYDLSQLAVGDVKSMLLPVYDAGTEGNSELAATLPGPVTGGEGFNEMRDDVDFVSRHSGVVTSDDGLTQSALDESHRFEALVAKVTIERTN